MIDQNGTQHDYTLDNLGRQVSDVASVLGSGVYAGADAVRRIDTAYDLLGNVALTTRKEKVASTKFRQDTYAQESYRD